MQYSWGNSGGVLLDQSRVGMTGREVSYYYSLLEDRLQQCLCTVCRAPCLFSLRLLLWRANSDRATCAIVTPENKWTGNRCKGPWSGESIGLCLPTAFKHRNGLEQCSEISEVMQFWSTEDASALYYVGFFAMCAAAWHGLKLSIFFFQMFAASEGLVGICVFDGRDEDSRFWSMWVNYQDAWSSC